MEKLLIALDLDGTVLHEDESVDQDLAHLLARLDAHPAAELVFATGRAVDATTRIATALQLNPQWVVACNGAVTLRRNPLSGELETHNVRTFDATEMLQSLYERLPGAAIAVESADGNFYYLYEMPGKTLPNNRIKVDFEKLLQVEAIRVVATSPAHSVAEFFEHMDDLGYAHTAYVVGETAWLDAAPAGVNKAYALEPVRKALGVHGSRVFAAGDGMNDVQMLEWANVGGGHSVAMGQAYAEVQEIAQQVTGTISAGGLYQALSVWTPVQELLAADHSRS